MFTLCHPIVSRQPPAASEFPLIPRIPIHIHPPCWPTVTCRNARGNKSQNKTPLSSLLSTLHQSASQHNPNISLHFCPFLPGPCFASQPSPSICGLGWLWRAPYLSDIDGRPRWHVSRHLSRHRVCTTIQDCRAPSRQIGGDLGPDWRALRRPRHSLPSQLSNILTATLPLHLLPMSYRPTF